MMNWIWLIPWVAIVIFAAGWRIGSKLSIRKERIESSKDADLCSFHRQIDDVERRFEENVRTLYKYVDDLERKINKEEH